MTKLASLRNAFFSLAIILSSSQTVLSQDLSQIIRDKAHAYDAIMVAIEKKNDKSFKCTACCAACSKAPSLPKCDSCMKDCDNCK